MMLINSRKKANKENEDKYNQQREEITQLKNLFNDFNQKHAKKCEEQEKNNKMRLDAQANLIKEIDNEIIQLTDKWKIEKDNMDLQIVQLFNKNKVMKSEQAKFKKMVKQDLGIYFILMLNNYFNYLIQYILKDLFVYQPINTNLIIAL